MKRYKSDLDFLENYWKDAKEIADNVWVLAKLPNRKLN